MINKNKGRTWKNANELLPPLAALAMQIEMVNSLGGHHVHPNGICLRLIRGHNPAPKAAHQ